jgi:hypothetical protein
MAELACGVAEDDREWLKEENLYEGSGQGF